MISSNGTKQIKQRRLNPKPYQPICLIRQKQRDVQNIIVQRKFYPQFDLIRKQLFAFPKASAGKVGLGFYLDGENIVLPLDLVFSCIIYTILLYII